MKVIFTTFILLFSSWLLAQNTQQLCGHQIYHPTTNQFDFTPCGTPNFQSRWQQHYKQNKAAYNNARSPLTTTYLPLTLHIVGENDSTGYGSINTILAAFCKVNQDYASTNIQFFIEFPIRYIPNTAFNNHDSVHIGGGFMLQHNVPNTSNIYFVSDPAGNCGYNLPYAGMAVGYSCLGGNTFSHELGHSLSIMHPFLGWEGGQSYNSTPQRSFSAPAPSQVYYNYTFYKDTMWLDTLIVDTAAVEMVARTGARANCQTAADGFCDTPADYLAFRWPCNRQELSNVSQIDPDTVTFRSEGWNIMSYSTCLSRFSNDQATAMHAFVQNNISSHLYNPNPVIDSIDINTLTLIEPLNNAVLQQTSNITFRWNSVAGATHYVLKICAGSCSPNTTTEEILLTDTFYTSNLTYNPRVSFLPFRWTIKPFNQTYSCANMGLGHAFNTQFPTNLQPIEAVNSFSIYPNPLAAHQSLWLETNVQKDLVLKVRLLSIAGQDLENYTWNAHSGKNTFELPIKHLAAGVYLIYLENNNRRIVKKLVVN